MIENKVLSKYAGPPKPMKTDFLSELKATWGRMWGAQGLGKLRLVLVHRPGDEAVPSKYSDYSQEFSLPEGLPHLDQMQKQHDEFVDILKGEGCDVVYLDPKPPLVGAYGIPLRTLCYTRESVVVTGGAIIDRPAPLFKKGLEVFHSRRLVSLGCPILYTVHGNDYFEASNLVWLDAVHAIIGVGLRTNLGGVDQITPILRNAGVQDIHIAHMPGYLYTRPAQVGGMSGTFHLDMVFGMVDEGLGVLYPGGVGYNTIEYLEDMEINLIEVNETEVCTDACNLLPISPGKIIIPSGNPQTSKKLRTEGVDVIETNLSEFVKGGGGPTCITLPLIRDGSKSSSIREKKD